nr:transmembrane protein 273 isoform X2 [Caretta caretta]
MSFYKAEDLHTERERQRATGMRIRQIERRWLIRRLIHGDTFPYHSFRDFWSAKVSASGTSEEEEIDPKYVIIGVTLGAFLAIGFLALKICMIKRQLTDSDFVDSDNRVDKRSHVESAAIREEVDL